MKSVHSFSTLSYPVGPIGGYQSSLTFALIGSAALETCVTFLMKPFVVICVPLASHARKKTGTPDDRRNTLVPFALSGCCGERSVQPAHVFGTRATTVYVADF